MPLRTRFVRVSGNGLSRDEVHIALYWKAELAADGLQLNQADVSKLETSKTKIAKTAGEIAAAIQRAI